MRDQIGADEAPRKSSPAALLCEPSPTVIPPPHEVIIILQYSTRSIILTQKDNEDYCAVYVSKNESENERAGQDLFAGPIKMRTICCIKPAHTRFKVDV